MTTPRRGWFRRRGHPATGPAALFDQGLVLLEQGDRSGAEHRFRRAADAGDLGAMQALGELLASRGDEAGAEVRWRTAAEAGHSAALLSLVQQVDRRVGLTDDQRQELTAGILAEAERPDQAVEEYRAALRVAEALRGRRHRETANVRTVLAMVAMAARHPFAVEAQRGVVADLERLTGEDSEELLVARSNLANALVQNGRRDEAAALFGRVVADHRRVLGTDHPGTVVTAANHGNLLLDLGRDREAAALFAELLPVAEDVLGPDHPVTVDVRAALGGR